MANFARDNQLTHGPPPSKISENYYINQIFIEDLQWKFFVGQEKTVGVSRGRGSAIVCAKNANAAMERAVSFML